MGVIHHDESTAICSQYLPTKTKIRKRKNLEDSRGSLAQRHQRCGHCRFPSDMLCSPLMSHTSPFRRVDNRPSFDHSSDGHSYFPGGDSTYGNAEVIIWMELNQT